MPELPDITIYLEALERLVAGRRLEETRLASPFVLRTADPPLAEARGKIVHTVRRIGKRIVLALEDDLFLVVHLMITGRFHWHRREARVPRKVGLAAFDFPNGTLMLTEASTKQRASLHLVRGEKGLEQFDQGGIEPHRARLSPVKRTRTLDQEEDEANYCATCQTGGRLLADRALSRLLGDRRPKTVEELGRTRKR